MRLKEVNRTPLLDGQNRSNPASRSLQLEASKRPLEMGCALPQVGRGAATPAVSVTFTV